MSSTSDRLVRSSASEGRAEPDTGRLLAMILVVIAVGFRFRNGPGPAIAMVALAAFLGLAVATVAASTGLVIRDEESAQAAALVWVFPLSFISSAFVPVATMPGRLQAFASNQPFTIVIDTLRYLALGSSPGAASLEPQLWQSLAWLAGIVALFGALAVRASNRASWPLLGGSRG